MERDRSPSSSSDEWSVVDEDVIELDSESESESHQSEESNHLDEANQPQPPSPVILEVEIAVLSSSEISEISDQISEDSVISDGEKIVDEHNSSAEIVDVQEEAPEVAEEAAESEVEVEVVEDSDSEVGIPVEAVEAEPETTSPIVEERWDEEHEICSTKPVVEEPESEDDDDVEDADGKAAQTIIIEFVDESLSEESSESESSDEEDEEDEIVVVDEHDLSDEPAARYFVNPEKVKESFDDKLGESDGDNDVREDYGPSTLWRLLSAVLTVMLISTSTAIFYQLFETMRADVAARETFCTTTLDQMDAFYGFGSQRTDQDLFDEYLRKMGIRHKPSDSDLTSWTTCDKTTTLELATAAYSHFVLLHERYDGARQSCSKYLSSQSVGLSLVLETTEAINALAGRMSYCENIAKVGYSFTVSEKSLLSRYVAKVNDACTKKLNKMYIFSTMFEQKKKEVVKEKEEVAKEAPKVEVALKELTVEQVKEESNVPSPSEDGNEWKQIREAVYNLSSTLQRTVPKIVESFESQLKIHAAGIVERVRSKRGLLRKVFAEKYMNLKKALEEMSEAKQEGGEVPVERTCHASERPLTIKPCEQHALIPSKGAWMIPTIPPVPQKAAKQAPKPCGNENPILSQRKCVNTNFKPLAALQEAPKSKDLWFARRAQLRDSFRRRVEPCEQQRVKKWSFDLRGKVRSQLRSASAATGAPFKHPCASWATTRGRLREKLRRQHRHF